MENIDKNADILSILDGYKNYAAEYEERKKKEEKEEEARRAEERRVVEENLKRRSIQEEIAETLRKIKDQESADAKRFEEERKLREEKQRKAEEMKNKIEEELRKIKELENLQNEQIRKIQEQRDQEKRERKIKELEEQAKREKEEAERRLAQKKLEEIERKRVLAEMEEMKVQAAKEEARKLARKMERDKAEQEKRQKERIEQQEKLRKIEIEAEKKRLLELEREKEQEKLEKQRLERIENDRKVAAEILERQRVEEEERMKLKQEAEEARLRNVELQKKAVLEDKKRNILQTFQSQKPPEPPSHFERPKKKSISNPLTKRFEEMAAINAKKEEEGELLLRKKKVRKSKNSLHKSKQLLRKVSKESVKKSQTLLKKLSNDSLKNSSFDKINRSFTKLRKSLSRECIRSKPCIDSSKKDKVTPNKQEMQSYLISQVLFDGKDDVRSSRMAVIQKTKEDVINEDEEIKMKEREIEEENRRKEREMIEREYELKKKIEAELAEIRRQEEERVARLKEEQFEAYKNEMEKYLNFVCEDKEETKKVKKTQKKKSLKEPSKKLTINIGSIKNQFEKESESTDKEPVSAKITPTVKKLNPILFNQKSVDEEKTKKKKEYVPIIIDKDAFERTKNAFEKEKKEEEERQNQIRIKQRQAEMEADRLRLVKEKEERERAQKEKLRKEAEERERTERERRQKLEEQERIKKAEELKAREEEERRRQVEEYEKNKETHILDQIKNELSRIKEEDEKMKAKIEKERKRKSLMQQIQSEISRIKGDNNDKEDMTDDILDDETPSWIKKLMLKSKEPKAEPSADQISNDNFGTLSSSPPEDIESTPAWIKIFEERSRKLEEAKQKMLRRDSNDCTPQISELETQESSLETDLIDEEQVKQIKRHYFNFDLDTEIAKNENLVQKSVKDLKVQLEKSKEIKTESKAKIIPENMKDKAKKVKAMFFENKEKEQKQNDKAKKKISKEKAKQIKNIFESTGESVVESQKQAAPKKPKRKLLKLQQPVVMETEETQVSRQNKTDWKWKEKSVAELYNYINSNKQHVPNSLAETAKQSFTNISKTPTFSQSSDLRIENEELEFENYISSIHDYIDEKDSNETESCFKDTIKAYLDLIDSRPEQNRAGKIVKNQSAVFTSNTAAIKDLIEENMQKEHSTTKKDIVVGKVDSSFLSKPSEEREGKKTSVSKILAQNIIEKFENRGSEEAPSELYSMKRRLIPSKPDVDTSAWKKQQVEHQWKYKQKNIEDLHKYIHNIKEKESDPEEKISSVSNEYTSLFKHLNFASRLQEEEKKMEEFEKFMDEIHDFLESDTTTEHESAFKWGIHSYIDMIESDQEKTDIAVKYERKVTEKDKIPKLSDIKAKLERRPSVLKNDSNEREIGKLNVASFIASNEEEAGNEANNTAVGNENVSKTKSLFEVNDKPQTEWEKTVVRRKLIEPVTEKINENIKPGQNKKVHDWKYKKKDLQELQSFINKNKDIASDSLLKANQKMIDNGEELSSRKVLEDSAALVSRIVDRDAEFESFMEDLRGYMNESSNSSEQQQVKDNIRQYLELIEPNQSAMRSSEMPNIGSARKIRDIKQSLTSSNEKSSNKNTVNTDLIGKVTHFFKKNTNQKLESNVVKENISSLLEPGKAKLIKMSLESKPKLSRCSSAIELPVTKLPKKNLMSFSNSRDSEDSGPSLSLLKSRKEEKARKVFSEARKPKYESEIKPQDKKKSEIPVYKSQWDSIEDPEEKKKAILAKYGLKPARNIQNEKDDMEEILNYENKDDMKDYERELHRRYFLCDSDDSRGSSPEPAKNNKGSHSSLLNILNVMKKATNNKSFADSKAKVLEFGKSTTSKSEVDLTDISKSCTDVRNLFENYQDHQTKARKQSLFDEEEMSMFDTSSKKARWENMASYKSSCQPSASSEELFQAQSISRIKEQLGSGRKGEEEEEDRQLSLQEELEELRQSAKLRNMFRLEKGRTDSGPSAGLRRTNSCIGVTGERLPEDLDEDTMMEVSISNKMVKAMFEENAPKYKFGGSGSKINVSNSKENVSKNVVTRPSVKPKEERKWVLDTINKYFEVIVEEEDEEEDDEEDESSDDTEYSEYEYDEEEDEEEDEDGSMEDGNTTENFKSTTKMRGILTSVVSKISGSVGNLARQDLMQNLKQNLGSQINLRTSCNNLSNS